MDLYTAVQRRIGDIRHLSGATREVFLFLRWAIKIPRLHSWRTFLWGLLANMQEVQWSGQSDRLCPVLWSLPGGFLVVMPRCTPISSMLWPAFDFDGFVNVMDPTGETIEHVLLPVEKKCCSFGWLDGRVVAVDYGS